MSDNPRRSDYQVEHDPGSPGKGAGSGDDFASDLQRLYDVGRNKLPEIAQDFSEASTSLDLATTGMETAASDMDGVRCMKDLLRIRKRLQVAAYRTTLCTQDSGNAVLRMVDLFASADGATADAFNNLSKSPEFRNNYDGPRPKVDPPADPNLVAPEHPRGLLA